MAADRVSVRVPAISEIERYDFHWGFGERLCRDGDCLQLRFGDSDVWPDLIDAFKEVHERDVRRGTEVEGAEYRGVDRDGRFVRQRSLGLDRVHYRAASRSSADHFDKIIDSMCWLDR